MVAVRHGAEFRGGAGALRGGAATRGGEIVVVVEAVALGVVDLDALAGRATTLGLGDDRLDTLATLRGGAKGRAGEGERKGARFRRERDRRRGKGESGTSGGGKRRGKAIDRVVRVRRTERRASERSRRARRSGIGPDARGWGTAARMSAKTTLLLGNRGAPEARGRARRRR